MTNKGCSCGVSRYGESIFWTFYTCRICNVLSVSSFVQLASVTSRSWKSQNPTGKKNYRCVKWTNKKACTSKSSKNLPKTRPSQKWLKNWENHMYHQPGTPDFFQNTITWHLTSSKVWMHQIRTSPNFFSCRFRGKMATLFCRCPHPLRMECMKLSSPSLWTTFGHLHSLKLFRCVYTKQCNHKNLNKVYNNLHWATAQRSKPLAYLLVRSFIRFVQPKQLSALTGFLIPEHWHDGEVLVIGIPHFSRDLGPTWIAGNIIYCQLNRHIWSNPIVWCLMLWWRVQPAYCPC